MLKRRPIVAAQKIRRLSIKTKILLLLASLMTLSYSVTLLQFQHDMREFGKAQFDTLGKAVTAQTALSSAQMLLAKDWVSLNISLRHLTDDAQIQGAEVLNADGQIIAQSGKPGARLFEAQIEAGDERLGKIRLYLTTQPMERELLHSVRTTGLYALLGGIALLGAAFLLARHLTAPLKQLRNACRQLQAGDLIQPLDESRWDELGEINRLLNDRFALRQPAAETAETAAQDGSALTSGVGDTESAAPLQQPTPTGQEPPVEPHFDIDPAIPELEPAFDAPDTRDVAPFSVDLSPLTDVPAYQNEPAQTDTSNDEQIPAVESESLPQTRDPAAPANRRNHYLLYVDHVTVCGEALNAEERRTLLTPYRKALQRVGELYNGQLSDDSRGNWCLQFNPIDADEAHGINALCAAQLFNGLYRGLNQRRIRHMQPLLNLQMAISSADYEDTELLQLLAADLSKRVQCNDLISTDSLLRTAGLFDRVLDGGELRHDEGNVLVISRLCPAFQQLIDRQSEHLLNHL